MFSGIDWSSREKSSMWCRSHDGTLQSVRIRRQYKLRNTKKKPKLFVNHYKPEKAWNGYL